MHVNSIATSMYHIKREKLNKLKKNQNIMLPHQYKGRVIVMIGRNRYTSKCLNILNTEQFWKLDRDPTKPIDAKIQRAVRKIKSCLSNQEYMRTYPTGSAPGIFYGTVKKHKDSVLSTCKISGQTVISFKYL